MMACALAEHNIRRFIASISPANEPSLMLARKLGFLKIGEQIDEEDGPEDIFECVWEKDSTVVVGTVVLKGLILGGGNQAQHRQPEQQSVRGGPGAQGANAVLSASRCGAGRSSR